MESPIFLNFGAEAEFDGALDQISGAVVTGWAVSHNGQDPVEVTLIIDDRKIATTPADQHYAGSDGSEVGHNGFKFDVPSRFLDRERHRVRVFAGENFELLNSPQQVVFAAAERGSWHLDGAQIVGAVVAAVDGPIRLDIHADGRVLGTVALKGVVDSPVTFSTWLPWKLADGRPHEIRVRRAGDASHDLPTTSGQHEAIFSRSIRSVIDRFEQDTITGWVFDVTNPSEALEVILYDGEKPVARTKTRSVRADVNEMFGITGTHGFDLSIPRRLFDGQEHDLRLVACETILRSDFDTASLPRILAARPDAEIHQISGLVESISCTRISGWAVDRANPFRPVHVAAVVDGRVEIVVYADRFEKRFQRLTTSGHHGFQIDLPLRLGSGSGRQVEVKILENDTFLADKTGAQQHSIHFPLIDFRDPGEAAVERSAFERIATAKTASTSALTAKNKTRYSVSLIVLNWNGADLLRYLLGSLSKIEFPKAPEIIVVDHNSSDDSKKVSNQFRDKLKISFVARDKNYSFSESNNLAAQRAKGDYLFFINNDIVLTRDVVSPMAEHLANDSGLGIIGIRLVEPLPRDGEWTFATHHRGIHFIPKLLPSEERHTAYFPVETADDLSDLAMSFSVPAVTAAAFMCRKADFVALKGFDEQYFYGMEDVDFCLRMKSVLGKGIVCDTALSAIHYRSATRQSRAGFDTNPVIENPASQGRNSLTYVKRFGYHVRKATLRSLVDGGMPWRGSPLRVAFAVTDASTSTRAGDFFTALELGTALRTQFGWEAVFVRHTEGHLPGVDLLIAMRHDVDLSEIQGANPGLVTAAWIRNRLDEWRSTKSLDDYNLIFCSSQHAVELLKADGREAVLLPIATNAERFHPDRIGEESADVVFTGNHWGVDRDAIELIDLPNLPGNFAIYGSGWDNQPRWAPHWKGVLPYDDMANVYASAKIVIDDSHPVTRDMHSLNSRVFDALAAGALVLTNCVDGARSLFGEDLPIFSSATELNHQLQYFLTHERERQTLVAQLRKRILKSHTYEKRAHVVRKSVSAVVAGLRIAIKIGVPRHAEKERWGDWHFAVGLKRALSARGCRVRIDILPDWNSGLAVSDDVNIVVRGLSRYEPKPGTINLMWLISHPEAVTEDELRSYDHVFVASTSFAERLASSLGDKVSPLLQCTDPDVFHPADRSDLPDLADAVFIGNSRRVRRKIVDDALAAKIDLCVFGGDWAGLVPPNLIKADFIPNSELHRYYTAASLLLNDHWPDMRREGFLSNRLFDAGACGAAIISDPVRGLSDIFGDAILTCSSPSDLNMLVSQYSKSDAKRRAMGEKLRKIVLAKHTFAHRAEVILQTIKQCEQLVRSAAA